jgi:hypothetical protein
MRQACYNNLGVVFSGNQGFQYGLLKQDFKQANRLSQRFFFLIFIILSQDNGMLATVKL